MSEIKNEIITLFAPENGNVNLWLKGRATKNDVIEFLTYAVERVDQVKKELMDGLKKIDDGIKTIVDERAKEPLINIQADLDVVKNQHKDIFTTLRMSGLQTSTLLRLAAEDGSHDRYAARQKFSKEFMREVELANYVDSLAHTKGTNYEKTMAEKWDLVKTWNAIATNVPIDFDAIGLGAYLIQHPEEFDETTVSEMRYTLHIPIPGPVEVVENVG